MKWTFAFPAVVFYVKNISDDFVGRTNAFIIRIKEEYKNDEGLLEHELVHVKQWWLTLGIHSLLYNLFKGYRYMAELSAYKKQLQYANNKDIMARKFARFIATRYGLSVTVAEALKDLQK